MKIEKIKRIIEDEESREKILRIIQIRHEISGLEKQQNMLRHDSNTLHNELQVKHKIGFLQLPSLISVLESEKFHEWFKDHKVRKHKTGGIKK